MISECVDLKQIIAETDKSLIRCIDTEGTAQEITQVSIVDGTEKELVNRFFPGNGTMSKGARKQIITLLNGAKILIGYNIAADLNALARKNISIPAEVIIVDLYMTFQKLADTKQLESPPAGQKLMDAASYYGINDVCGYHNSMVDSTITMRLFWEMNNQVDGKFVVIQDEQIPELGIATEVDIAKGSVMGLQNPREYMDYSGQKEEIIRPISKGMYEAVVNMYGTKAIVRLTKQEYKLFKNIRKVTPNYPLWVFYRSVVAPGVLYRDNEYKEKEAAIEEYVNPDALT